MSITLKSKDKESFEIPNELCKLSKYLQNEIDNGKTEIQLKDIKGDIIELIIKYLQEYQDKKPAKVPKSFQSNDLNKELSEFDAKFISEVSFENTIHLINASVFLNLQELHDVACSKISSFIIGKTPQEIKEQFTLSLELTEEEAKELGIEIDK